MKVGPSQVIAMRDRYERAQEARLKARAKRAQAEKLMRDALRLERTARRDSALRMAAEHNIARRTVYDIVQHKTWREVL